VTLRLVFMGSPQFAVPTLKALHQDFKILAVFSQADKPTGRGKILTPTPVKQAALQLGLTCHEPGNLKDPRVFAILKEMNPEAIIVVAYGKFLPKNILDLPPLGCLNLHASLLPRHRGPSPISAALLSGDKQTGATVMLMDSGMDTGQILAQSIVQIGSEDAAGELHDKLMEQGALLMVETVKKLAKKEIVSVPQDESKATYCKLLKKTDGLMDWNLDAQRLDRIVRAMNPWPGAFFTVGQEAVKVWRGSVLHGHGKPGTVIDVTSKGVLVGTGQGLYCMEEVQAPSKKRISAPDFARGKRLKPGASLT
jgi:methionyl-tRNA formyltransferase